VFGVFSQHSDDKTYTPSRYSHNKSLGLRVKVKGLGGKVKGLRKICIWVFGVFSQHFDNETYEISR